MRSRTYGSFDHATLRQSMAGPGMDTRQWTSMGVVDPDEGSQRAVTYDPDYGPLVHVTLEPSGIPVVCRVSSMCAGSGEGDGEPFAVGDEVVVIVPEGDERTGPVIVGRCNNTLSPHPSVVAGIEIGNNASYKRRIGPIAYESNTAMIFRVAATDSFLSLSQDGNITASSGDKSFLHLGADFVGLQTGDSKMVLQGNQNTKVWRIESQSDDGTTVLQLGGAQPGMVTSQSFFIGTQGQKPWQHLVTLEQLLAILAGVLGLMPLGTLTPPTAPVVAASYLNPLLLAGIQPLSTLGIAVAAAIAANSSQDSGSGKTGICTGIVAS